MWFFGSGKGYIKSFEDFMANLIITEGYKTRKVMKNSVELRIILD